MVVPDIVTIGVKLKCFGAENVFGVPDESTMPMSKRVETLNSSRMLSSAASILNLPLLSSKADSLIVVVVEIPRFGIVWTILTVPEYLPGVALAAFAGVAGSSAKSTARRSVVSVLFIVRSG